MMQLPPVNYDHSFDGQVVEHRLSNEAAAMACARIGVSGASCMIKSGATCVIYIPAGYGKAMTAYYTIDMRWLIATVGHLIILAAGS